MLSSSTLSGARVTGSWRSCCSQGSRRDGAAVGLAAVVWGAAALVGAWPGLARCYRALGARRRGRHGRICLTARPGYVSHPSLSLSCACSSSSSSSSGHGCSTLWRGLPCPCSAVVPCSMCKRMLLCCCCASCCAAAALGCYAAAALGCCAATTMLFMLLGSTGLGHCCHGHASAYVTAVCSLAMPLCNTSYA